MRLGTQTLTKDVDFFPSVVTNDGERELWPTLDRAVRRPIELAIGTPQDEDVMSAGRSEPAPIHERPCGPRIGMSEITMDS